MQVLKISVVCVSLKIMSELTFHWKWGAVKCGLMIFKKVGADTVRVAANAMRPDDLSKGWGRCGATRWSLKKDQMQCGQMIFKKWTDAVRPGDHSKGIRCCQARWSFKEGQDAVRPDDLSKKTDAVRPDDLSKRSQVEWSQVIFQTDQMLWGQMIFQRGARCSEAR